MDDNRDGRGLDPATAGLEQREIDEGLQCFRVALDCPLHGHGAWLMNME